MAFQRSYQMQGPSRSHSSLGLAGILVTYVLFALSNSVCAEETEELVGEHQVFTPNLVNGDYNGAFETELVVWRPSEGMSCEGNENQSEGNWYIIDSVDETHQ